jgi:serine/threonine protein kinase
VKVCPTCSREFQDNQKFCPSDGSALRAKNASADLVGQVVADRYHILKKLGEGGMGAVYLGEHVKMGRKSAIKVMAAAMSQDPDAISRFNREASNASRISHPNVCQIYDFGETPDGLIYLAMEFIEGQSLKDLVEKDGALPPPRAAAILRQAADALQAAHDLGIVHRDIKPDNIMVVQGRDGADIVKVVDFGIARAVGGDEPGQKVTKTGLVVGTPEYMSPEQLSGDKLDGRSDIYSLALVLYRMLTGTLPFEADSAQEVMIKRLTDEPMPLEQARTDIAFPPKLQLVLNVALARQPAERYQSAAEFGRDTMDAVAGMAPPSTRVDVAGHQGATHVMSKEELTQATSMSAKAPAAKKAAARSTAPTAPAPAPSKRLPLAAVGIGGVGVAVIATVAVLMAKGGGDGTAQRTDSGSIVAPLPTTSTPATSTPATRSPAPATSTPPATGTRPPATSVQLQTSNPPVTPSPPPGTSVAAAPTDWRTVLDSANAAFDDDQLGTARTIARRVYDAGTSTGQQKASAAILIANTYAGSNPDQTIAWFRNALRTATPSQRTSVENALRDLGVEP